MSENKLSPLDILALAGDLFWEILGGQNLVLIVDTRQVVYARDGYNTRFNLSPGDPVKPTWITARAMASGKREVDYVSAGSSSFGFAYAAMAIPVREDGKIIGAFTVTSMLDKQQEIRAHAESLNHAIAQLSDATDNIAESSTRVAQHSSVMESTVDQLEQSVGSVGQATSLIRDIAEQTPLLGLNAAIEAARAGDQGRGFNVVATEIRQLSATVKENVKTITASLSAIEAGVTDTAGKVRDLNTSAQNQAAAEEISATIHDFRKSVSALETLSRESWL